LQEISRATAHPPADGRRVIDTGTDHLIAFVRDGVAVLTMNRPERRNALSPDMLRAMGETLRLCEADPEVGCVVLTGAGAAFCAGGDVKGMAEREARGEELSPEERTHQQRIAQQATAGKLHRMLKPTLAVLPGAAAGAGFALALACDFRLAADTARLTTAFARVGFSGDYGGTYFLSRLVGAARTRELYFFSDTLDAAEACRMGVVNWTAPAGELEARMWEIALRLANGPRLAFRYMKENINRALAGDFEECLDMEATHQIHTSLTEDHRNAARAFVEKRQPVFKGR
jgi:2-(1,2-epoxy-1,2-dihydrophenyl)acetyl-CoA isomerase